MRIYRKWITIPAASLLIAAAGIAFLVFVFGLRMEFSGLLRPKFSFGSAESHYRALQENRAAVAAAPPPAGSTYWADFRGPGRLGHYDQQAILTAWPAQGLRRLWKQPVGGGYASFSVAHGAAFTIEQRRGDEVVAAYSIRTGRERWTHSWPAHFQETLGGDGPRATPVWDEGRLYALGAEGELLCLEATSGMVVWKKNILSDNGASNLPWGMAASPLIVDGKAVVLPGGPGGRSVVAYDKLTGARIWGSLDDKTAYASPVVATAGGRRQLLVMMAGRAVGLAVEDGKLLWEYPWVTQDGINAVEPLMVAPNRVYLSSGYGHGATVLELEPQGEGFHARAVWASTRMKNKFNGPVLFEGHIYGLDEGILACLDAATGELKWKGGRYGCGQLLLASGHLVVLTEEGDVVLVRATPARHEEAARFSALKGKTWNYPAISDGLLLVRNEREMAAFQIGSAAAPATQAIRYAPPATLPVEVRTGHCWTSSIAAPYRPDAWRCMIGNQIADPCFTARQPGHAICGMSPVVGEPGFDLKLTQPLPPPGTPPAARERRAWLIELADGTICTPFTGTMPQINGEPARYGCDKKGAVLVGELVVDGQAWSATRAVATSRETVAVKRVWQ